MADQTSEAQIENITTDLNSGNANPGNRTNQEFVSKKITKQEKQNFGNERLGKKVEFVVEEHPEESDEGSIKCGDRKFGKKRIIIATVILTLLLAAVIIPIAVIFNTNPPEDNAEVSMIKFNQQKVPLRALIYPREDGAIAVMVFLMSTKIQITEPFTRTTATCTSSGKSKDLDCEVTVPVLDIIDSIYQNEKQPIEKKWLIEFYKNTQSFLDNFQNLVKTALSAQALQGKEKIQILSVAQRTLFDVRYNSNESKFTIGRYENSINTQDESPSQQKFPTVPSVSQDLNWIDKIFTKASRNLREVILTNLRVIKSRSSNLANQQRKLIQKKTFTSDWQEALTNKCITVSRQLFRCTLEGANKLVPSFRIQDTTQIPSDVITTSALVLKVKQSSN